MLEYIAVVCIFTQCICHIQGEVANTTSESGGRDVNNTTYYFYSQSSPNSPLIISNAQELSTSANFDPSRRYYFFIHGWLDNYNVQFNVLLKSALLSQYDVNVIVVDWSPIANNSYTNAANGVSDVGTSVGAFINSVIDVYGTTGDQITLIGHSMGAHIAGIAGSLLTSSAYQIIGTDPAGPGFYSKSSSERLDENDAQYVQVIHTNGLSIGWSGSLGSADFYPNGGLVQPCGSDDPTGGCSHERAFQYLAEAINGGEFTSTACGNYTFYQLQVCKNNEKVPMGTINVDPSILGDFYLSTNSEPPYAQG